MYNVWSYCVVTMYVTETMFLEYVMLHLLCGYNLCSRNNFSRVYNVAFVVWCQVMTQISYLPL